MRETLRQAGVEVFDRDKIWRALPPPDGTGGAMGVTIGGSTGGTMVGGTMGGAAPPPSPASKSSQLQYHRAHDDHKPVDVRAVEVLLEERLHCMAPRSMALCARVVPWISAVQPPTWLVAIRAGKMQRNFVRADQIRDQLKQMHNVEVHDTERVWHVSRSSGPSAFAPGPPGFPYQAGGGRQVSPQRGHARGFTVHSSGVDGEFAEFRGRRGGDSEDRHARRERERSRSRSRSPKRRSSGSGFSG